MNNVRNLLKKSGYSEKAIEYYLKRVNFGIIKNSSCYGIYTGPCGDTMEIYLRIKDTLILDAKFRAIGCAGSFVSGSALTEMIKKKTIDEAEGINREDVIAHLGGIPEAKIHCACLAIRTLRRAIKQYKNE